jgi:hypothetical protein
MEPRVKFINRNIAKSEKCRCRYNNPEKFDFLVVNINYNEVRYSYVVESKYLSKEKHSIFFYPNITPQGELQVMWSSDVEEILGGREFSCPLFCCGCIAEEEL